MSHSDRNRHETQREARVCKGDGVADEDRHRFVAGLEAAVTDAYRSALDRGGFDAAVADVLLVLAQHHDEHATALAALAGIARADVVPNATLYAELNQTVLVDDPLPAVIAVEEALAATHVASLGELTSSDGAAAVASIVPVEAQHVVVAGVTSGLEPTAVELLPVVQLTDRALTTSAYGS